ncbi:hypothetical protein AO940_10450 [Pseudomonas aeruginosa]|nr:hypothetical protein AO940_10450 [Pseudomonas aeruginosa]PTC36727.1 hypothetical protein CLJ1_2868 [Pseudomonas aeruginosa]
MHERHGLPLRSRPSVELRVFAAREVAAELTGMQFDGITAFGLSEGMPLLVDAAALERPLAEMGAGIRGTKLLLSPELLKGPSGVVVAELSEAG